MQNTAWRLTFVAAISLIVTTSLYGADGNTDWGTIGSSVGSATFAIAVAWRLLDTLTRRQERQLDMVVQRLEEIGKLLAIMHEEHQSAKQQGERAESHILRALGHKKDGSTGDS